MVDVVRLPISNDQADLEPSRLHEIIIYELSATFILDGDT